MHRELNVLVVVAIESEYYKMMLTLLLILCQTVALYRLMIQIARTRDDGMTHVEQFLQMLTSTFGKDAGRIALLPQNEIKWIVTDSYNNGIYYYK